MVVVVGKARSQHQLRSHYLGIRKHPARAELTLILNGTDHFRGTPGTNCDSTTCRRACRQTKNTARCAATQQNQPKTCHWRSRRRAHHHSVTVLLVQTGHDAEHQGLRAIEETQREVCHHQQNKPREYNCRCRHGTATPKKISCTLRGKHRAGDCQVQRASEEPAKNHVDSRKIVSTVVPSMAEIWKHCVVSQKNVVLVILSNTQHRAKKNAGCKGSPQREHSA